MQPKLWKMLDNIEAALRSDGDQNGVVFIPLKGESNEDMDIRITRWKAGEIVEGVNRPYQGEEEIVAKVVFVGTESTQN